MSPVDYGAFRAAWTKSTALLSLRTESGVEFSVGPQVFDAPEAVYFGSQNNLVDGIVQSLSACGNGVGELHLAGKASLLPGLADRLQLELSVRGINMEVVARPDRGQIAYSNAAKRFAVHSPALFVGKERYDEVGPDVARDDLDAAPVWLSN